MGTKIKRTDTKEDIDSYILSFIREAEDPTLQ